MESVLDLIQAQFKSVNDLINPATPPCPALTNLLSSPYSPFYTALIILTTTSPTHFDSSLVEQLSPHIPIIALPPFPQSRRSSQHLSSFRPADSTSLRSHLFRSPEVLASLRVEGSNRFLRWREVHRVQNATTLSTATSPTLHKGHPHYHTTVLSSSSLPSKPLSPSDSGSSCAAYYSPTTFDPLHLPSIVTLSVSLLSPLRHRIFGEPTETLDSPTTTKDVKPVNWGILGIVGVFCAGIGLGMLIAS